MILRDLSQNFSREGARPALSDGIQRVTGWIIRAILGTFIMYNRKRQEAVDLLSNRTYEKDERAPMDLRPQLFDGLDQTRM